MGGDGPWRDPTLTYLVRHAELPDYAIPGVGYVERPRAVEGHAMGIGQGSRRYFIQELAIGAEPLNAVVGDL